MQHWKLWTPGDSPVIGIVLPGATMAVPGGGTQAAAWVKGTFPGTPTPFNGGTNPPPKAVTSVNVWFSPPLLVTRSVCPDFKSTNDVSNR